MKFDQKEFSRLLESINWKIEDRGAGHCILIKPNGKESMGETKK